MKKQASFRFEKVFPWVLIIGGAIGLLAAVTLTVEKIAVLQDPTHQLSCSINPILSCGPIMNSSQASVFGLPNIIIGIAIFPLVTAVGVMLLAGATKLKRWFWLCFQLGTVFGIGFVAWLISQSLYVLHALCIYCMVVWAVTIPIFWSTLSYTIREGHIKLPGKLSGLLIDHVGKIITVTYLLVTVLIVTKFSDYFYTLI